MSANSSPVIGLKPGCDAARYKSTNRKTGEEHPERNGPRVKPQRQKLHTVFIILTLSWLLACSHQEQRVVYHTRTFSRTETALCFKNEKEGLWHCNQEQHPVVTIIGLAAKYSLHTQMITSKINSLWLTQTHWFTFREGELYGYCRTSSTFITLRKVRNSSSSSDLQM